MLQIHIGLGIEIKIFRLIINTMRVPETIIINRERLMVKKIVGSVKWNSDVMIQLINNVLNNSPI